MHVRHWQVLALVSVDLTAAAAAPIVDHLFSDTNTALQVAAAVIAVWTYFFVWVIQRDPVNKDPRTNSVRDAITASFVVTYLVMVAWTAFFNMASTDSQYALDPLGQTFISNFTFLTGVVVGSYFGADVVKQVAQIRHRQAETDNQSEATREVTAKESGQHGGGRDHPVVGQ
ncbi:MAG: hypothetical protein NVSMB60_06850 [Mycobacterium sp.]